MLKPLGDKIYTMGTNRFVFHRYAMQPWLDLKPGMTCGPFGLMYERTNTWWEQSRAWHTMWRAARRCCNRGSSSPISPAWAARRLPADFPRTGFSGARHSARI